MVRNYMSINKNTGHKALSREVRVAITHGSYRCKDTYLISNTKQNHEKNYRILQKLGFHHQA